MEPLVERNDPLGFGRRTIKNLDHMMKVHIDKSSDIHIVTHIVNSALGLVVFPQVYASTTQNSDDIFRKVEDMTLADNFPYWKVTEDTYENKCINVNVLLYHIRNALAHRRISFSSDSRNPAEVDIIFRDKKCIKKNEELWEACIRADYLREFCAWLFKAMSEDGI